MPTSILSIDIRRDSSETVVALRGECDVSNIRDVNLAVRDVLNSDVTRVVVDLEQLVFAGACILGPLEALRKGLAARAGLVVTHRPSEMVAWLLGNFGSDH
jgi:anti-anti-sigma factor